MFDSDFYGIPSTVDYIDAITDEYNDYLDSFFSFNKNIEEETGF